MSADLTKRAEELDQMRSKRIAEKLTLEEAENIMHVWSIHLEHTGGLRTLFKINIPKSLLPYPIDILQGALNKMEAHYYEQGLHDRVKLLERTEAMLMQYENDDEAINNAVKMFGNKKWRDAFLKGLRDYQLNQAESGYLVNKKLWKLSKYRIEELHNEDM
jgi:hypothetical protein